MPAFLGAPGQTAKVAGSGLGSGGCWGAHGDWNLGGLSNGAGRSPLAGSHPGPEGRFSFLLSAGGCMGSLAGGLSACGALELGSKGVGGRVVVGSGRQTEPEGRGSVLSHGTQPHTCNSHAHAHRHAASASAPAVLISLRRGGRACASHCGAASAVLIAGPPCFPGDLSMGPGRGCRAAQSSLGLAFVSRQAGVGCAAWQGSGTGWAGSGSPGGVGTARGQCGPPQGALCPPGPPRRGL